MEKTFQDIKYDKSQIFKQCFDYNFLTNKIQQKIFKSNFFFSDFSVIDINSDSDYKIIYDLINKKQFMRYIKQNPKLDKCIAIFLGNAVGDALGAHTEFCLFNQRKKNILSKNNWQGLEEYILKTKQFRTPLGVITDDCSMAKCMADSILCNNMQFNPIDMRIRFLLWWYTGYNNGSVDKGSFGLGGNIHQGFKLFLQKCQKYVTQSDKPQGKINGNGSIMRLSPIPIAFHNNIIQGEKVAILQSLTTHNGEEAAEACKFLTHLLIKLINYDNKNNPMSPIQYMIEICDKYQTENKKLQCLIQSKYYKLESYEKDEFNQSDKDCNFQWRNPELKLSPTRFEKNPTYYGSYVLDCLYIALYIVYHSETTKEAIFKAVNWGGDSDSIASVVGYICGGLYGLQEEIYDLYMEKMYNYDKLQIILKAWKLFNQTPVKTEAFYKENQQFQNQELINKMQNVKI